MNSPKHVKLKLRITGADPNTGRVTEYEFKTAGGGGLANPKGDLDFKSKASFDAPAWIDFFVYDETTHDMKFDRSNPVNVVKGKSCPEDGGIADREFILVRVRDKKLTLLDRNETDAEYSYTLCFRSTQTGKTFLLDPVVSNGGGGNVDDSLPML